MPLFVKVIPLRAGTSEPAGQPRLLCCPADVEPDTLLSFLTQRLGEPVEPVWTSTEHHQRVGIGWVFRGAHATGRHDAVEFACVPFIESSGGALQRRQSGQLADNQDLDATVLQQPHRVYHPADKANRDASTPGAPLAGPEDELDQTVAAIACQAGAALHTYPRPGHASRRVVLRDERDDRGTRHLDAALEHDGTLRITGHDQGPRVSEFWGEAITSYEWVYVVAADRIPALIRLLDGSDGDDVLALLAACHQRPGGQISDFMNHPDVTADFSNWHS